MKLCPFHVVLLAACLSVACRTLLADEAALPVEKKRHALSPEQLAVVINDAEPNSVEIGKYYLKARKIPAGNLVHVNIPDSPRKLSATEFSSIKQRIEEQLSPGIQALLLVWTTPYAVECNSITSALTLGFDPEQCKNTCAAGKLSRYFNAPSALPFDHFGMRISMLLPSGSVDQAKSLIDRGVLSEFRGSPQANAYFVVTTDNARNSRIPFFPPSGVVSHKSLTVNTIKANTLENAEDVMFYQIGLPVVTNLNTVKFLPGALADHLTSSGGDLLGKGQMSSLRWLEAGATASYGTVSEPCNYWQKFPNPTVLLKHYLSGTSAIEAYWKSVAWPAQGVFIGEPLAAPYSR